MDKFYDSHNLLNRVEYDVDFKAHYIDGMQCLLNTSTSAIARAACQVTVAHDCGFLRVNSIVFTRNGR